MTRIDFSSAEIDEVDIEILSQCEKQENAVSYSVYSKSSWLKTAHSLDIVYIRIKKLEKLYLLRKDQGQMYSLTEFGRAYLAGFRKAWHVKVELEKIPSETYAGTIQGSVLPMENPSRSTSDNVTDTIVLSTDKPKGTIIVNDIVKINGILYRISQTGSIQGALVSPKTS